MMLCTVDKPNPVPLPNSLVRSLGAAERNATIPSKMLGSTTLRERDRR